MVTTTNKCEIPISNKDPRAAPPAAVSIGWGTPNVMDTSSTIEKKALQRNERSDLSGARDVDFRRNEIVDVAQASRSR